MGNLSVEELALQRKRYPHLSDEEFRFMLQQVEGRQRTKEKLPTFATINDWWYPVRLSCEQCSSEITAKYKAELIKGLHFDTLIDLTAGYGVDTYFMSQSTIHAHYIERNYDLCQIAEHNFRLTPTNIQVHNTTTEEFLESETNIEYPALFFIDPARRGKGGNKVFLLEDCEPNVISLIPTLLVKAQAVLIKLSPMLDITAALRALTNALHTRDIHCEVHVVAVQNEVKEVLLFFYNVRYHSVTTPKGYRGDTEPLIHAVNLIPTDNHTHYHEEVFTFTTAEEKQAQPNLYSPKNVDVTQENTYIYEPNAAIIKAGAFKLIAQRVQLLKMAQHTHLYLSHQRIDNFPGRVWQIITTNIKDIKDLRANIMTRNYPLTPEQLRKKLKLKDSDTYTIIGARLADKPTLFLCKKI